MIDIHAHILPGVDDGAFEMEESIEMARIAVESGVEYLVATPHCNLPEERLWANEARSAAGLFQQRLQQEGIPLKVAAGMEIFGTPEVPELLRRGELMGLAGSRYALIEFPFSDYGRNATAILEAVADMGLCPVVAHPERYTYVQGAPELLNLWHDLGCLFQINRGSLLGRFGRRAETVGHAMVERGFASFVASDAHSAVMRTPWMEDVERLLRSEYSPALAHRLLEENPRRVLMDQEIKTQEPDWF